MSIQPLVCRQLVELVTDYLDGALRPADRARVEAHLALCDDCDGYVVLVVDPQTAEVDAHGPYGGPDATMAADSLKTSLTAEGLDDVAVRIVRLHLPRVAA